MGDEMKEGEVKEGEIKVKEYVNKYFILRVSWVFGINGKNFVKTIIL